MAMAARVQAVTRILCPAVIRDLFDWGTSMTFTTRAIARMLAAEPQSPNSGQRASQGE
jgi:hypothetical protein